jgi:hypothetical protein
MELQKCLHCGGEPYIDSDALGEHIRCIDCGAQTTGETVDEAAQKWNRRADGWVSVEDGLPEDNDGYGIHDEVLVKHKGIASIYPVDVAHLRQHRSMYTHWRPLPAPPEVKP